MEKKKVFYMEKKIFKIKINAVIKKKINKWIKLWNQAVYFILINV